MVLDDLKTDRVSPFSFVKENLSTYAQFEKRVLEHRIASIPINEIDASNATIR